MANLDRISIALPKGMKDVIKGYADSQGKSVNAFIACAIDEAIKRECDLNIMKAERRCQYRLGRHDIKLHKEKNERGEPVYYLTDEINNDRPDDNDQYRWFTLHEIINYCEELEEKDNLARAEEAEARRANRG